jgi:N-acetylglucosamine kinase-like BadF-type ATPase
MSVPRVLAVDGGNSKTDLALAGADGRLLALMRGPTSSPHAVGLDRSIELLAGMLAEAIVAAGIEDGGAPVADVARIQLAGADQPDEEEQLQHALERRGWATRVSSGNDTFAVLRAGTDRGWGVAVVCGAGINCVGVAPDGRSWRFPALGPISGDWGGGGDIGLAALGAAARSADGRGPATLLERAVPEHFGLASPLEVARAIHLERLPCSRLAELVAVVFAAVDDDPVAAAIVARLADELTAFARAAIERLGLQGEQFEVVLGGGVVRRSPERLAAAIRTALAEVAPNASVLVADAPPIAGAALLALDDLDAPDEAKAHLRAQIIAADRDHPPGRSNGSEDRVG